jgi:CheY-like chemotaxis protein
MSVKILIADGSAEDRKIIKSTLLSDEFNVFDIKEDGIFEAKDGLEAFGIMGKHPDIEYFFSEVDMAHLNGDELLEVLNDTGKINRAKVIFISNSDINAVLSTATKKCILGTISKPVDAEKILSSFKKLLSDAQEKEQKEQQQKEEVKLIQDEQKSVIRAIIEKYYILSKYEKSIDIEKLQSIINVYINEDDFIPSEDLMIIIAPIVSEFLMEMEIVDKVDNYKLQFLFDNQLIEVKEDKESSKKATFEANLMNDPNITDPDVGSIDMDSIVKKVESSKVIEVDLDTKEVVDKRFLPIVEYIKSHRVALEDSKKELDYIRMKSFMFKAYDMLTDVDFTIDIKELKDIKKNIELLLKDIDYFVNFKNKTAPDYCFNEIFAKYQHNYLVLKYASDEMFKNREAHKEYRTVLDKLDKQIVAFEKNETKSFYNMFMKQLQKIIVAYYSLINRYTYKFDELLWEKARASATVKNFFQSKRIVGPMCTKSLLSYYVKINKVNDEDAKRYSALAAMLEKNNPKNVVFISSSVKDSALIESAVTSIDTNWHFYTLAKLSLVDSWITGNDMPDILIIDSKFDTEVEDGYALLKHLYKKYGRLQKISHRIVMLFDKVSIDTIEKAGTFKVKEFMKRPLIEAEVKNKLRFL